MRINRSFQVDAGEVLVAFETFQQIVVASVLFDFQCRGLAVHANLLVQILTVTARSDRLHQDVLGRHERQFGAQVFRDRGWVDDHSVGNVLHQHQCCVDRQERLRDDQAAVGTVVECTFHPLSRRGHRGAALQAHDKPTECTDSLAPHRVAFVGHRRAANLFLFKRLFDFFAAGEQADVGGDLVQALPDSGQGVEQLSVDLAWVSLSGDRVDGIKGELFRDSFLEGSHFVLVAREQLEEAGLGSRGALGRAGSQRFETMFDRFEIKNQVVDPQAGSLSDRGGLSRLKVGEGEAGQVAVLGSEFCHLVDRGRQAFSGELKSFANQQQVRVVGHKATGRAEVDDPAGVRALVPICVHMSHHIVAQFTLVFGRRIQI